MFYSRQPQPFAQRPLGHKTTDHEQKQIRAIPQINLRRPRLSQTRIGDQLPTVRQLAVDLRINANTVAKVYAELERAGVLETRRGVGTFVSARPNEAASRRDRERHLRELAEHFISETQTGGFSIDDVIEHLEKRRRK